MSQNVKKRVVVYVWEPVIRWSHWVTVVCILILVVTGYLMGNPVLLTKSGALMTTGVKVIHYLIAIVFSGSIFLRIIWMFVGNEYASWKGLIPMTAERRKNAIETLKWYFFLRLKSPGSIGHNALAGMAYAVLYLICIIEIITGYALYTLHYDGGVSWLISLFGAQEIRLVHHVLIWVYLAFVIHHVYSVFLCAMSERNGLVEAMFDGYKFIEEESLEKKK